MEHSEVIEADLARWYPRDADQLLAFYRGEMTLRRLWVLSRHLPRDSFTGRALHGEIADWTPETHLLARACNMLTSANAQRAGRRPSQNDMIKPPRDKKAQEVTKTKAKARSRERDQGWRDLDKMFNVG